MINNSFWDLFNFCFAELEVGCKIELEEKIKNAGSYGITSDGELIIGENFSAIYSNIFKNYDICSIFDESGKEKEFVISSYISKNSDLRIGERRISALSCTWRRSEIFPILREDYQGCYDGFEIEYNGVLLHCSNNGDGRYTADSYFSKKEDQWKTLTSTDQFFEEPFYILEFSEYEIDDDGEKISVGEGLRLGAVNGWAF